MNAGQITGLVVLGLGILMVVLFGLLWRQQTAFWRRALQVDAMVVGHQEQRHRRQTTSDTGSGSQTYYARHPVFAFRTAQGYDVETVHGSWSIRYPDYYSGQRVRVSYDPGNPENVATGKGGEVPVFRVLMLVGVGLVVVGIGIWVVAGG